MWTIRDGTKFVCPLNGIQEVRGSIPLGSTRGASHSFANHEIAADQWRADLNQFRARGRSIGDLPEPQIFLARVKCPGTLTPPRSYDGSADEAGT